MITKDVFARRRERFYDGLGEGVALLFAAPEALYGHDTHYRYRPDPDLFYLTGFAEPEAVGVFDAEKRRYSLFVRPRDRERETWDGRRAGVKGAVDTHGAWKAHPISELAERLPELVRGHVVLHHAWGLSEASDRVVSTVLSRFRREARDPRPGPSLQKDPLHVLHELRLFKEPEEVAVMQRSADIAAQGHREAMKAARPGRHEYEIEGLLERTFRAAGASGPAYASIVASGANATILHYVENRRRIEADDLVLVDAGCELHGYASDITRTFPASGRFTKEQKRVYEIVLAAQKAAIAKAVVGNRYIDAHDVARETMVDGLLDLGLLKGRRAKILAGTSDKKFLLHRTSHWLGLDVHDRGRYNDEKGEPRLLEPGMVLTVEPGLYFREDEKGVPKEWLGIGVRIEDDVLVTQTGPRVLSEKAPKELDAVLALTAR
ncbi:MAG: aminopeptidase P N-terminal domain-containing protein [Acidobacteria bacterium]|nr:aminopeptidase P N-terminal domain-containing protein [Acidobacteriota bacterium]